jgi:ribosomal protein S18 acetylase RimI-like enzyme
MSEKEFEEYWKFSAQEYAQEHVRAGNWSAENAIQKAEQSLRKLLPAGLASESHHLLSVENETPEKVGVLWFQVQERDAGARAFVYDVRIHEEFRRRGYGTQAFQALEAKARELGLTKIVLHVFGHNHAARALYEKLGYVTTDLMMSKTLST